MSLKRVLTVATLTLLGCGGQIAADDSTESEKQVVASYEFLGVVQLVAAQDLRYCVHDFPTTNLTAYVNGLSANTIDQLYNNPTEFSKYKGYEYEYSGTKWGKCPQALSTKFPGGPGTGLDLYKTPSGQYNLCLHGSRNKATAWCLSRADSSVRKVKNRPSFEKVSLSDGKLNAQEYTMTYTPEGRQVPALLITAVGLPDMPLTMADDFDQELTYGNLSGDGRQLWQIRWMDRPPAGLGVSEHLEPRSKIPAEAGVDFIGLYQLRNRSQDKCLNAGNHFETCEPAGKDSLSYAVYRYTTAEDQFRYMLCLPSTLKNPQDYPRCEETELSQASDFPYNIHYDQGHLWTWTPFNIFGINWEDAGKKPYWEEFGDSFNDYTSCTNVVRRPAYVAICAQHDWLSEPPIWAPFALAYQDDDGNYKPNQELHGLIKVGPYNYYNPPSKTVMNDAFYIQLGSHFLTQAGNKFESSSNLGADSQQINRAWDAIPVLPIAVAAEAKRESFGIPAPAGTVAACPANGKGLETPLKCNCTAAAATSTAAIWGTDFYTADSALCKAAVHRGIIEKSGGTLTVYPKPGLNEYVASTRNGVTSKSYGSYTKSFSFDKLAQTPPPPPTPGTGTTKGGTTPPPPPSNRPPEVITPVYIQLEPVLGPYKYQIEVANDPGSCISYDTRNQLTIERCKTAKIFDVYSNKHGTYDFCKEGSATIGGTDSKGECVREGNLRRLELKKDVVLRTRAGIAQGAWVLSADGQDHDDAFINKFGHRQTPIFEIHSESGGAKRWEHKSINQTVVFDQSGLQKSREWRLVAK